MLPHVNIKQAHAEFAPSSFFRFILCSGSYMLSKFMKEEDQTPQSKEGTDLHKCVENETLEGLDLDQEIMVEKCIDVQNKLISKYPNGKFIKRKSY